VASDKYEYSNFDRYFISSLHPYISNCRANVERYSSPVESATRN
jgi:hypothetical protein